MTTSRTRLEAGSMKRVYREQDEEHEGWLEAGTLSLHREQDEGNVDQRMLEGGTLTTSRTI